MNWEALGAIGEIVGAVAVIADARLSRGADSAEYEVASASIADSHYRGVVDWVANMASDRELGRTYFVGIQRFDELAEEDQRQFLLLVFSQLKLFERLHYQFCQGNIEEELWNLEAASLHLLIHSPAFCNVVRRLAGTVPSPGFQDAIVVSFVRRHWKASFRGDRRSEANGMRVVTKDAGAATGSQQRASITPDEISPVDPGAR